MNYKYQQAIQKLEETTAQLKNDPNKWEEKLSDALYAFNEILAPIDIEEVPPYKKEINCNSWDEFISAAASYVKETGIKLVRADVPKQLKCGLAAENNDIRFLIRMTVVKRIDGGQTLRNFLNDRSTIIEAINRQLLPFI